MIDFSTVKLHCSQLYRIMASAGGEKTPKERYAEAIALLEEEKAKLESLPSHHEGRRKQKLTKIAKIEAEIAELEPNKEDDSLSAGAKKYMKEYYGFIMYGKWGTSKDAYNRYTAKGNEVESESLANVSLLEGKNLEKNEIQFENDYLIGTPDVVEGEDPFNADFIRDIKSPWDIATFFSALDSELNPQYYWQIQGYFALTNCQRGEIDYCLVDVPEALKNDEKLKLAKRLGVIDIYIPKYEDMLQELDNNLTFSDIPLEHKMLSFPVERNQEDINRIYGKIKLCRDYLSVLHKEHMSRIRSLQ